MRGRLCALIAAAVLLAACSKESKQPVEAASKTAEIPQIQTAKAVQRTIDRSIFVTGTLDPDETVSVSSEVPGRVSEILVDFGQNVQKGQVLVKIDTRELALQLERAKASLSQALARLGLDPSQQDVRPESTPQIRQATAQMEDARSKFENASQLLKTGDIARERQVELEKALRARQAALDAARDDMRTQAATVDALRAEVKLAEKRLSDATVRAPFDGAVGQKLVSPGQYTKENTPLLTIVKTTPLRLRAEIPESAAGSIRTGTMLNFSTDAFPGEHFTAKVRELNPSLDEKSRSLSAEARLTKPDPRLRPGMFVQVELVLSRSNQVTLVPKQAIYSLAGLNKLFVLEGGKVREYRITPGQEMEGWVEVPGGKVKPGDAVATGNLAQLTDGMAVRPKS